MHKVVIVALVASVLAVGAFFAYEHEVSAEHQWEQFKLKHNKSYSTVEETYRLNVFKANLKRIKMYAENDKGAKYGVTKFADLTQEEFRQQFLGLIKKNSSQILTDDDRHTYVPTNQTIPASFDWRTKNVVTPVKNQGQCGSCWAFSAIQNIEGQNAIKHNKLIVLSEQELVDCDKVDQGCDGGLMEDAMTFLQNNGGVVTEQDYPYTGEDGTCSLNKSEAVVQVTGYLNISTNETVIAQSLVELGPLSIAVHADPWQFYFGGISNPYFCSGDLDHGVLLVGYGRGERYWTETDFWTIKNSWGADWGEDGYIRLVRGQGVCGCNQDVITGTIA